MRLSVTLDLIVRLLRKDLDDLLAMSLFIKVQMSINVADRCYNMDRRWRLQKSETSCSKAAKLN
jgi:hypothetical protein